MEGGQIDCPFFGSRNHQKHHPLHDLLYKVRLQPKDTNVCYGFGGGPVEVTFGVKALLKALSGAQARHGRQNSCCRGGLISTDCTGLTVLHPEPSTLQKEYQ